MMNEHNIEEINKRIEELKREISAVQGSDTEVYARIVGYYRSVGNWNKGKREEYNYRKNFMINDASTVCISAEEPANETTPMPQTSAVGRILCFVRKTCPNCPPVKAALEKSNLPVEYIDADTNEGLQSAVAYGVMKAPTVLFLDADGRELLRTSSAAELESLSTVAV